MKIRYTEEEYANTKATGKLKLECYECGEVFLKKKNLIQLILRDYTSKKGINYGTGGRFCSHECDVKSRLTFTTIVCKQCGKERLKSGIQLKKFPNSFCSKSCAASYNNTHKKHGTRKSKLETWLEQQLTPLYPDLEFHFNRKDAINSELDIYIPSLKLAFELNGLFHYEPIFGEEKLKKIQNNDQRKFQACLEKGIELCLIDVSTVTYFKLDRIKKYLTGICEIINNRLSDHDSNVDKPSRSPDSKSGMLPVTLSDN